MEKIPCIECNKEMWAYIKPYLEKWGYRIYVSNSWEICSLLTINYGGEIGGCNNYPISHSKCYYRKLVTDVEEFLERAAQLKGFTYKRKIMEINGVEIKPGMGIYINEKTYSHLYIVFPIKDGLGVIPYGEAGRWLELSEFLETYKEKIVAICGLAEVGVSIGNNILWEKPKEVVITMDQIAEKFGYPVEQIKIMK